MTFKNELEEFLPIDLPNRELVCAGAAQHLSLIEETNQQFNLTRITSPRDAAIKHVVDSVMPWRLFSSARRVLDIGTGAGFPGIPLSLVLPQVRFTLSESIRKKARFVEGAVQTLGIANIEVSSIRAEELLADRSFDLVTARAVAPLSRLIPLFGRGIQAGARFLLYKGPDVEQEIAEAAQDAGRLRVTVSIVLRYELPGAQGLRTIVELIARRDRKS
jgi:16S rRNA (guanine527-N7)-methyltransferase